MIIHYIDAKNFRKYKSLSIRELPDSGVITISGPNESGKSSIADSICFGLFGQTHRVKGKKLTKLIHWGTTHCQVELGFNSKNTNYYLTRKLDLEGQMTAQLRTESGIVAETPESVDQALQKILQYNFETFADSLHLTQDELGLHVPDSKTIKEMAGIGKYARLSDDLHDEIDTDKEELAKVRPHYDEYWHKLEAMQIDDEWLPELVSVKDNLEDRQNKNRDLITQLDEVIDDYPKNQEQYRKINRFYRLFGLMADVLLPIIILLWVIWGAVQFLPEYVRDIFLAIGSDELHFGAFVNWTHGWLYYVAAILTAIYGISLFVSWQLDITRLRSLRLKAAASSGHLYESYQQVIAERPELTGKVGKHFNFDMVKREQKESEFSHIEEFIERVSSYFATPQSTVDTTLGLQERLMEQNSSSADQLLIVNKELEHEFERTDQAGVLRKELNDCKKTIKELSRNVRVREEAITILQDSAESITNQFNDSITAETSRILPMFTRGRYDNIELEHDFSVRLYSDEKQGFTDFDEVSYGTQHQVMLALRIAMAEEFTKATNHKKQFILLDEPFAFFDHERTVDTIAVLGQLSGIVTQVWVISQEFPDEAIELSDNVIAC